MSEEKNFISHSGAEFLSESEKKAEDAMVKHWNKETEQAQKDDRRIEAQLSKTGLEPRELSHAESLQHKTANKKNEMDSIIGERIANSDSVTRTHEFTSEELDEIFGSNRNVYNDSETPLGVPAEPPLTHHQQAVKEFMISFSTLANVAHVNEEYANKILQAATICADAFIKQIKQ